MISIIRQYLHFIGKFLKLANTKNKVDEFESNILHLSEKSDEPVTNFYKLILNSIIPSLICI